MATVVLIVPAIVEPACFMWPFIGNFIGRIRGRSGTAEGGYGMYGGLPLALLLAVPVLYALRLPFLAFWDVGILSILTGMIFARVGCFLNGCCSGRPSNVWFSLYLPNHLGVWKKRIPSHCLESVWAAVLLGLAILVWPRMPFPGELFLWVCCFYPAGRLVLESFREPENSSGRFTLYHAISLAIIVLAIATLSAKWLR